MSQILRETLRRQPSPRDAQPANWAPSSWLSCGTGKPKNYLWSSFAQWLVLPTDRFSGSLSSFFGRGSQQEYPQVSRRSQLALYTCSFLPVSPPTPRHSIILGHCPESPLPLTEGNLSRHSSEAICVFAGGGPAWRASCLGG